MHTPTRNKDSGVEEPTERTTAMLRIMGAILIFLSALPTFSQSKSAYQVGTIMAVAPHRESSASDSSPSSYDVSVKVGDTNYVVLYTPPFGEETVKYAAGRDLLVLIGEKTVTFNDELGNSSEIPILSRATVASSVTQAPNSVTPARSNPVPAPPQPQTPVKSVELVGLAGFKDNTQGTLTIGDGKLHFAHSKKTSDIAASSVEDVITGDESQRAIRGTVGTISMFGPYGSGRFLSLFRSKLDSLTVQYRDADGGWHGVVFGVPVGQAELIKKELVAEGAHTKIPVQAGPSADSSKSVAMEEKQ